MYIYIYIYIYIYMYIGFTRVASRRGHGYHGRPPPLRG